MINTQIKRFKTYITEDLVKEAYLDASQRSGFVDFARGKGVYLSHYLDRPSDKAKEISGNVMPDTIKIPMMNSTMQAVHDHLKSSGYSEVDYGNKVAHRDIVNKMGVSQRITTNIGKALSQTKADQSLINSFNNDNHKESADLASKYDVVISRVPHDIAACSTNTPWTSCATLTSTGYPSESNGKGEWGDINDWENEPEHKINPGYAAAHLPQEILHGTHVAYMVPNMNHPDNQRKFRNIDSDNPSHADLIDNAQARILLKPFVSDSEHTILRPETKGYIKGHKKNVQVPQGFKDTLRNFADTKFPAQENVLYRKHSHIYDDDHKTKYVKLDINKPFHSWEYLSNESKADTIKHSNLSSNDITNYLSKVANNEPVANTGILEHLPSAANFNKSHLESFYKPEILSKTNSLVLHDKLIESANKEQYDKLFDHIINSATDNFYAYSPLVDSKHFNESHIKKALTSNLLHKNVYFANNILSSTKLKGDDLTETIKKALTFPSYSPVIHNFNLTPEHISMVLQHPDNFPNHGSGRISTMLVKHSEKVTPEHIDQIIHNYKTNSSSSNFESLLGGFNTDAIQPRHLDAFYKIEKQNNDSGSYSNHRIGAVERQLLMRASRPNSLELNDAIVDNMIKRGEESQIENVIPFHQLAKKHIDDLVLNNFRLHNISNHLPNILDQDNLNDEHFKTIFHPDNFNQYPEETQHSLKYKLLQNPDHFDKFVDNIAAYPSQYHSILGGTGSRSYSNLMGSFDRGIKFFRPEIISKLSPSDKMELLKKMHTAKTNAQDAQRNGDTRFDDQIKQLNTAYKNVQGML